MSKLTKSTYISLIQSIGSLLSQSRQSVLSHINTTMVHAYRHIGRHIVEYEQQGKEKAEYGSGLLQQLAHDLTHQFGKGFSYRNIRSFRQFYSCFPNWQTVSARLSRSHYCLLMRLDEPLARDFYAIETTKHQRSVRVLERHIESMLFERIALSKDKQGVLDLAEQGQTIEQASDIIKDPYIFEFLNIPEHHRMQESELEEGLLNHLQHFLLEMGDGFTFVARQKRITMDGDHYYMDLVLYHRLLQCFVIIDLKKGKLTHQDIGQMQMYVHRYDREIKTNQEHKTIGLILCADKKESTIQYTLPEENDQIFASKYKLYLPDKEILQQELHRLLNQ